MSRFRADFLWKTQGQGKLLASQICPLANIQGADLTRVAQALPKRMRDELIASSDEW